MGRLRCAINAAIDVVTWPLLGGVAGHAASAHVDRLMRWVRPDDANYQPEGIG